MASIIIVKIRNLLLLLLLQHCNFVKPLQVFQQDPVPDPFVLGDRYPNRTEFDECRPIQLQLKRTSSKFNATIAQNANPDLNFATADASLMTLRQKLHLDILADLYHQKLGGKLNVLLSYADADNSQVTTNDSLHFEGRTSRIAGSDPSELPEILQLAVQAGFDWVTYEDENYARVSVISDICQANLDLLFLLDESGSVTRTNHELALQFIESVVSFYDISTNGTRVAMISFSSDANVVFDFDDYSTSQQLRRAIREMNYSGGYTFTALALDLATELFNDSSSSGARPLSAGIPRVAVLITDGRSNVYDITQPATDLKMAGVTVYSIGIGNYDIDELRFIASDPHADHVFLLQSYTAAAFFTQVLRGTTCDTPATVYTGMETESEVAEDNFRYFLVECSQFSEHVIVELTEAAGQCAIYASTEIANPSPINSPAVTYRNEEQVLIGTTKEVIIPTNQKEVVYVAVRGTSPSTNRFKMAVYNDLFNESLYSVMVQSDVNNQSIVTLSTKGSNTDSFLFELINEDDALNFNIDHDGNIFVTDVLDPLVQDHTYFLTILASNVDDLCQHGKTTVKVTVLPSDKLDVSGDPHFRVPLLSNETLCYSIQGYPGLAFNLIYNQDFIINAFFIDSIGDEKEATWIGKLAVIPRHANNSKAVIFDSVKQEVVMVDQGHFKASVIDKISYDESGKMSVKFTPGIAKQAGNPTVHVKYDKPLASFDVTFYSNHLDVNWDLKYESVPDIHGLMGQFMVKGMAIDPMKKILTYPDGRDPVAVEKDDVMTGKTCWKAMNPGYQGEGLIKGSVLNYMVSNLLADDFKMRNF